MIRRQYVSGITTEGFDITVQGNTLTLGPGRIGVPDGEAVLAEAQTFVFEPQSTPASVMIGFDRLGRLYVERPIDGDSPQADHYGILTHLVYFDLPPGEVDLSQTIINVVRGKR